ncbi:MAG TPA: YkgJ family cysteine cluster protein [Phycisphaerae bacterium]|nr:YkgJ family cysteine cluster protein [Phycisphaerae bacterium]
MKVSAKNVEALAARAERDNWLLRSHLKWQDELDEPELDQLVFDTTRRVWEDMDCTRCANCCRDLQPTVTEEEAGRLAGAVGMSVEDFRAAYLEELTAEDYEDEDLEDGAEKPRWRVKGKPCPFLRDNRCTVYEHRPSPCRGYPYLYEPAFSFRTWGMIERTFTCPVVYRVLEELKKEFPDYRRSAEDMEL